MQIVVISGMSGAGKSSALAILEDAGYYCIDNLPSQLLEALLQTPQIIKQSQLAIGIDIRGGQDSLEDIPVILNRIKQQHPKTHLIYLYAADNILQKRFNETRRRHPLADKEQELSNAIRLESQLLSGLTKQADWRIDSSGISVYELGHLLRERLAIRSNQNFSLLFQSFGFKHEAPSDSDFIFDVRCLPNPYWSPELRPLTGLDTPITDWLETHERVTAMTQQLTHFLENWLDDIRQSQRAYLTVSIGCTGGRHRSVYIAEQLYQHFKHQLDAHVLVRHKELKKIR